MKYIGGEICFRPAKLSVCLLFLSRYYISKGAIVDQLGGDLNSTPLHWAIRCDSESFRNSNVVSKFLPVVLFKSDSHTGLLCFVLFCICLYIKFPACFFFFLF